MHLSRFTGLYGVTFAGGIPFSCPGAQSPFLTAIYTLQNVQIFTKQEDIPAYPLAEQLEIGYNVRWVTP